VDGLNPGMTAMTPRQLDNLCGRLPKAQRLVELLHAHPTSTPDADDKNARSRWAGVHDNFVGEQDRLAGVAGQAGIVWL
jgi:hypothetical protein